ncbi:MAG TPA: hypothetical protein VFZ05_02885 [Nitrososphaera sp.]
MAIEWDSLIVEMVILAAIIYGAVWVEVNVEKRKVRKEETLARRQIVQFVTDDLNGKMRFIDESLQYGDFKPFFTDMWDAILLGGKQTLLPFEVFKSLQHTYSWMKYYNNELDQNRGGKDALDTLGEVKRSISQSLEALAKSKT